MWFPSGSNLLQQWRATHIQALNVLSAILVSLHIREWRTYWMCIQSLLVDWSAQTLKSNSHPGHMSSHSCQWFCCSNTGELHTNWICVQPFSSVVIQTMESNSLSGCVQPFSLVVLICFDLLQHWRATHILEMCSKILISSSSNLFKHWKWLTSWTYVQPF